jgi:transcriptional antiterminator NusG
MKYNWYAVHTLSQSEYKVKTLIEKTKVKNNLVDEILDIIIPTDTEIQKKEGKKIEKKVKVFPGYILIRMQMSNETFNFVKRTPGITSFVSVNGKPVIIKDIEVKNILEALDPNKNIVPKKKWDKNMLVRIADGPFTDFTGKVEDINEQKETLTITISLFGRETPVEIDFGKVEKLT